MKKIGSRINVDHNIYPKKLGMFTLFSSAIDCIMKFGAFPIYDIAPINTAPAEIAIKVLGILFIRNSAEIVFSGADDPARLKKTKYVGALSKKLDKIPVNQKNTKFMG